MAVIETEVRSGLKTAKGAEGAAARLREVESIPGIRYESRPCSLNPAKFVVVRIDGGAERDYSITRPQYDRRFGGERDVASMRGKKSRPKQRGNGMVFA